MENIRLVVLIFIFSGFSLSCSNKHYSKAGSYEPSAAHRSSELSEISEVDFGSPDKTKAERKVIYTAFMTLSVNHPDSTNKLIKEIANKYGGYVNEVGTYRTVIRVKASKLNEAVNDISELGKVQEKSLSGQDVTEEFLDYQIRLENAQKARDRYLELLAKAENVEAALKVEKELERLNETIDLLKGRMNRIDHLSDYSTITVNLREKKKPGLLGYLGLGLYHSVKWLFVRN